MRSATRCCRRWPSACAGAVREVDTLARLGGDEFVDRAEPARLADGCRRRSPSQIIAVMTEPFDLDGAIQVVLGTSIGIAIAPGDGDAMPTSC